MKSDAQQATLVATPDLVPDVQKRFVHQLAVLDDPYTTRLLDDEQALVAARCSHVDGLIETLGNYLSRQHNRLRTAALAGRWLRGRFLRGAHVLKAPAQPTA